jgi:hypothetical protein
MKNDPIQKPSPSLVAGCEVPARQRHWLFSTLVHFFARMTKAHERSPDDQHEQVYDYGVLEYAFETCRADQMRLDLQPPAFFVEDQEQFFVPCTMTVVQARKLIKASTEVDLDRRIFRVNYTAEAYPSVVNGVLGWNIQWLHFYSVHST